MSNQKILNSQVVKDQLRSDIPDFKTGSVVAVHYKIKEGDKERIQIFAGLVTDRHAGNGLDATFTVLKDSTAGIKVERTFPLHSPFIEKLEVKTLQRARRANIRNMNGIKDPIKKVRTRAVKTDSK